MLYLVGGGGRIILSLHGWLEGLGCLTYIILHAKIRAKNVNWLLQCLLIVLVFVCTASTRRASG